MPSRNTTARLFRLGQTFSAVLLASAALTNPAPAFAGEAQAPTVDTRPFPREFKEGALHFWLYPPQFESLTGNKVSGRAAVSIQTGERRGKDGKVESILSYGVIWFEARTEIDKASREATLDNIKVIRASFPSQPSQEAKIAAGVQQAAQSVRRLVSLDQLEASIALGQARAAETSHTVSNTPPAILFAYEPTVLVLVDGKPVLRAMQTKGVQRVINTRSLLLYSANQFYLRAGGKWLAAGRLDARWALAKTVPQQVDRALAEAAELKLADPMDRMTDDVAASLSAGKAPLVTVATSPSELIQISGSPSFQPIAGTRLSFVANTPSDLFLLDKANWYVLISGRWFTASSTKGPWVYVAPDRLPADFSRIPPDSPKSAVLASVAGTPEAREALIANSIPQTASINRNEAHFNASYDGTPDFVPISGTSLSYARNAAVPVIRVDGSHYYAVSDGIWFVAPTPQGRWVVATSVPPAIYTIPVSSSLHYLTYVAVYGHDGDTVYVGYTPGYYGTVSTSTVVVYGTGYACSPWVGNVWYGCPGTYGSGAYFGYSAVAGWTFGFGWGYYPYYGPWWGAYWPGYYNAGYWGAGAYYPVAGAWNVYGQWGNAVVSGTAAAWADPWTGNYGRAARGGYYNEATGGRGVGEAAVNTNAYTGTTTAAAHGVRYNPETGRVVASEGVAAYNPYTGQAGAANHREVYNTNTGRQTSMAGAAGAGPEGAGAVGGFSSQGSGGNVSGAGAVYYDRDSGTVESAGVVKAGDNVYAGQDGSVYHQTDDGWEQVERSSTQSKTTSNTGSPQNRTTDNASSTQNRTASSSTASQRTQASGQMQTVEASRPSQSGTNGTLDREQSARNRGFDGTAPSGSNQRLDRSTFGSKFQGRVGGDRPAMNRNFTPPSRPRGR